jgi:hypothetical protein
METKQEEPGTLALLRPELCGPALFTRKPLVRDGLSPGDSATWYGPSTDGPQQYARYGRPTWVVGNSGQLVSANTGRGQGDCLFEKRCTSSQTPPCLKLNMSKGFPT